jgi:hypothetical protein
LCIGNSVTAVPSRMRQDRKGPAEMQFAEPNRIKAELVAKFDLGHDVGKTLRLGKAFGARQLVEKSKAHRVSPPSFSELGPCRPHSTRPQFPASRPRSVVPAARPH